MTILEYPLRLELLDDVVFSRRSATAGGHESLDKVPGSALLGWAAAQLYERLGEQAFLVFHSGAVRFRDGLPLSPAGKRCAPVPLAWHENKAAADGGARQDGRWLAERIFNLAAGGQERMPPLSQPRQLRSGYVGGDGACMRPATRYRMMTAIGEAGRAAEGQLFGYESLVRGQRFEARIGFEDSVPEALRRQVLDCFEGTIRLGRSRASQYGRVRAELGTPQAAPAPTAGGERLLLWLMSDAWLRTPEGQPALVPDAEALGLEDARLDRAASFLRTRSYSPWNAHRRRHEIERQVLCAGSVIALERPGGFTAQELQRLASGIGLGLAQGLGEVRLQSPLLATPQPVFTAVSVPAEAAPTVPAARPASTLIGFLARRSGAAQRGSSAQDFVRQALRSLVEELGRIRAFVGCAPETPLGPGRSQWGQLATFARQADSLAALRPLLLDEAHGACRRGDETWDRLGYQRAGDPARRSLGTWIGEQLDALGAHPGLRGDAERLYAWQLLCGEARKLDLHTGAAALDTARDTLGESRKETA
ncbi:type III-B CRISPR module-associated Cmr3 family protein [Caldimonas tepidiphila]|uniref:type III-B CRISPR module-associated Cmr3 family protein n=1 Tax=Caldimonas tepidiphila TaxID=2315841 RepID=UPI000E5B5A35|nr:hypothetical protein [Caldimonas tepidiphila]